MKRIIASAGLVVIGTASLQAQYAPGLTATEKSKPWSISATLRGFYDDNYNTAPAGPDKVDSFGIGITPAASLNLSLDQTYIGLRYIYDLKYYENRPNHVTDQTHQFDATIDHTFSERYSLALKDSFVIAQEPSLLEPSGGTLTRSDGNNMRNFGAAIFSAQMTTLLGLELGYANTYVNYEQDGGDVKPQPQTVASRSALLDRIEQLAHIDLRWQILRQTIGVLGYQFGMVDYTSNESIDPPFGTNPASNPADSRNSRSHFVYVGADQTFRPDLNGSIRVGGQYIDYYNNDNSGTSSMSPYAVSSLTYNYAPGSSLQFGARHSLNATDVSVLDEESTSVYLQLTHRITANLTGNVLGQFQYSTFNGSKQNGSTYDDDVDKIWLVGLNLAYRFNQYLSTEVGYNYDRLISSDIKGRSFSRDRVYVGVTASY